MDRYNIMWTGGLDSTYTMIVYSHYDIEIQPYYLRHGRKSEKYEFKAMEEIREELLNNEKTKAKILPLIVIGEEDIPSDSEVEAAYSRLKAQGGLGSQYDWIARYARHNDVEGLFYSPVKPTSSASKFRGCIEANGVIREYVNSVGRKVFTIDMENSSPDLKLVFGGFNLSETFDITKIEEEQRMRDEGYTRILEKTWFCHTPVLGKACGCCHPCETTIEAGQTWRFTESRLKRYRELKEGASPGRVRFETYIDVIFGR